MLFSCRKQRPSVPQGCITSAGRPDTASGKSRSGLTLQRVNHRTACAPSGQWEARMRPSPPCMLNEKLEKHVSSRETIKRVVLIMDLWCCCFTPPETTTTTLSMWHCFTGFKKVVCEVWAALSCCSPLFLPFGRYLLSGWCAVDLVSL